ncbi:MAG: undecaprenyl phosphate translocase family protein, partial [Brachybacterium sp.]
MTDTSPPHESVPRTPGDDAAVPQRRSLLGNLLRGALIGVVETVPGVSGGTVALVTGIYDDLIASGHHLTAALRAVVTGPHRLSRARQELAAVSWRLVIPLLI